MKNPLQLPDEIYLLSAERIFVKNLLYLDGTCWEYLTSSIRCNHQPCFFGEDMSWNQITLYKLLSGLNLRGTFFNMIWNFNSSKKKTWLNILMQKEKLQTHRLVKKGRRFGNNFVKTFTSKHGFYFEQFEPFHPSIVFTKQCRKIFVLCFCWNRQKGLEKFALKPCWK